MEFSCLQENLTKGLSVVNRAVSPRSTLDVLGNVLISAEEERVRLSATNLEIGIHCWIGAEVAEDGSVAVPARILTDFVSSLPPEKVDMKLDVRSMRLHLDCDHYIAAINGVDGNEFPLIPVGDGDRAFLVDVETIRKMVAQTAFAASTQESRPSLTGILMEAQGDVLSMVASDGYRLSHRTARLSVPVETPFDVLVPAKAMSELARVSADAADGSQMQIFVNDVQNQAIFHLEGKGSQEKGGAYQEATFVSQLIDARFPDYKAIIPKSHAVEAVTDTQSFLKAIRVAYLFARDEANIIRLELVPGPPGSILVKARSKELGENETQVQAEVSGGGLAIGFNARYLIEALSVVDTPQVALETTAADRPGVLKPVGSGEETFTYVMMPVTLPS